MTTGEQIGYGVSLSDRLRILMSIVSLAGREDATLNAVDQLLRHSSNEDLNEYLNAFEDTQPLTVGNGLTPDRQTLNEEFFDLRDTWGDDYPIGRFLNHDRSLRTHVLLREIPIGHRFQIDGVPDTNHRRRANEWRRVSVGGSPLINGRVPAQAASRPVPDWNVELLDPDTAVRPLPSDPVRGGARLSPGHGEREGEPARWTRYQQAMRRIEKRLDDTLRAEDKPLLVIYAAYNTDEGDLPIDNLDEVAVPGKVIFLAEPEPAFGGDKSKKYESPIVENATWLELCLHANRMLKTTRDRHHVYLEGVYKDQEATGMRADGVAVYRFDMGS